ncbi:MAG: PF20097 family protein [Candidatus Thorarchaeota archaeon]
MTELEKCPSCGETMEHGYIISGIALNWCNHIPAFACRCGERLDRAVFGCASLEGYRCTNCQIIRYLRKQK